MNVTISWDGRLGLMANFEYDSESRARFPGLAPGASWWLKNQDGQISVLRFSCPCGCGYVGSCPVKPINKEGWNWDGEMEHPTFASPSILMVTPCHWHGYLKKGVFESC